MTILRFTVRLCGSNANNWASGAATGRQMASALLLATGIVAPQKPLSKQPARSFSAFTAPSLSCYSPSFMTKKLNIPMARAAWESRFVATQEVTKNMQLFTEAPRNVEHDSKTLRLKSPINDKPLVVMLCWLQAKQKHVAKYAQLYVDQGFDVLAIRITPWQLLWPTKGTQLVALDIVTFLNNNPTFTPILLHGFSVGGYLWGECLVHIAQDMNKYKGLLDRIQCQVWDSAADITEIPIGVPKAMFPKNPTLQNALRKYMLYHMKTFHEPATSHYIRSSQMFHGNLARAPALFLLSKTDPVGAVASNDRVRENWERNGVKITWKCWDKSPHVGHFQYHRDEYIAYLREHLASTNFVQKADDRVRAKL